MVLLGDSAKSQTALHNDNLGTENEKLPRLTANFLILSRAMRHAWLGCFRIVSTNSE